MARSYQVSCPPAARTLIVDQSTKGGGPIVTLKNTGDTTMWLGGDENEVVNTSTSTLATTSGFGLAAGATVNLAVGAEEKIYGLGGGTTGTCVVYVFRTNGSH